MGFSQLIRKEAPPALPLGTFGRPACGSRANLLAAAAPSAVDIQSVVARLLGGAAAAAGPSAPFGALDSGSSIGPAPPTRRLSVRFSGIRLASRPLPLGGPGASELFCQHPFQCLEVQRLLGHHLLQPAVLVLQLPQPPRLAHLQTPVLRLPPMVGLGTDAVLPANLFRLHPPFPFLQHPDNLLLRKPAPLHRESSSWALIPENSHFPWTSFRGAGEGRAEEGRRCLGALTQGCKTSERRDWETPPVGLWVGKVFAKVAGGGRRWQALCFQQSFFHLCTVSRALFAAQSPLFSARCAETPGPHVIQTLLI